MKVSVVIPVFNEEKYLEKCLKSLVSQEEKADEIIIVDNNSTDKSIEIAKKFPVKIVKEKKQGIIFARNCGFNHAQSEIIARCDADTIVPKNWVKEIKNKFREKNFEAITFLTIFYDHPLIKNNRFFPTLYFKTMRLILGHDVLAGPAMAITKKIWEKVKSKVCLDEKKVHEDIDLSIHINKYGQIIFDDKTPVFTSSRRIKKNPFSFFVEYPIRVIKTIHTHKNLSAR